METVGMPSGEAEGAMAVEHRVQQYREAMASWMRRVGPNVNPRVTAHKAATSFMELVVSANRVQDVAWQAQYRAAIVAAGLVPVPLCNMDTDRDGNCHQCAAVGGCIAAGGPFIGQGDPTYASPMPGPQGDPL